MQLSARGGGECATAGGRAGKGTRGPAEKSIRLTRQTGAARDDNSFATGAGVIGVSAVFPVMTQHAIAAQQPSEKEAWCEQHRAIGAAIDT